MATPQGSGRAKPRPMEHKPLRTGTTTGDLAQALGRLPPSPLCPGARTTSGRPLLHGPSHIRDVRCSPESPHHGPLRVPCNQQVAEPRLGSAPAHGRPISPWWRRTGAPRHPRPTPPQPLVRAGSTVRQEPWVLGGHEPSQQLCQTCTSPHPHVDDLDRRRNPTASSSASVPARARRRHSLDRLAHTSR
jgi:hypothetical protein